MNKEILDEMSIYMGIDTLQVQSNGASKLTNAEANYINKIVTVDKDNCIYSYRLNPDKANNDLQIYNYSEFERVFTFMVVEMSLNNPKITRIDFRFDSFEANFDKLLKINKVIALLLSITYKMKNRYQSVDPLTLDKLTVRVQNNKIEAENYNKALQEPDGNVKNRLELRAKNLEITDTATIRDEYNKWISRLDKAVTKENFKELQDLTNESLIEKYKQEQKFCTIKEFLYKYSDSLYTRRQLVNFCKAIEMNNPDNFADNYKKRTKIEFFSPKDLEIYVSKIKEAGQNFFDSEK